MSPTPDAVLPVEALFDVPDDRMLVGDELLDPTRHLCCVECGSLCRDTAEQCFNCGSDFNVRP